MFIGFSVTKQPFWSILGIPVYGNLHIVNIVGLDFTVLFLGSTIPDHTTGGWTWWKMGSWFWAMDIYGDIVLHQNVKAGLDPEQYLHKWSMVNISGMINWYRHGDLWWHNVFFDIDGFYLMGMTKTGPGCISWVLRYRCLFKHGVYPLVMSK